MVEIDDEKDCASTSSLHRLLDPAIPSNENVSTALSETPKSENLKTNSSVAPPCVPSSISNLSTTTLATQPCLSTCDLPLIMHIYSPSHKHHHVLPRHHVSTEDCLLYTSDAADERSSVDLGGRRIIK